MRANSEELHDRRFDLVVVGGGIHGAAIAREAALRGCTTLLVERGDFASGSSSRSSRLIHGGVRYLAQGHFSLVREALGERERLLRLAPHLVRPLPVLMPFFKGGRSRGIARLGLWLYDRLARRSTLPRARSHSAEDCPRLFPGLRTRDLRGGILFYDAATQDARLTLAVLEAARQAGAMLASYVELVGVDGDRLILHDAAADRELRVDAGRVVNAAGPQVDAVRRALAIDAEDVVRVSRGSHIVLPPRDHETALAAFLGDGRMQFVIPHRDGTVCGTTDVDEAPGGEPTVPAADIEYLLAALAELLAEPPMRDDIAFAYAGWRSLPTGKGPPGGLNREAFLVDEASAAGPVHTVVGGKLTTHRAFAERALAQILGPAAPSPSRSTPLPGGGGPREPGDPLWWRHGSRAGEVRALIDADPTLAEPVAPDRETLRAEAVWALREQGVVTFADLMLRRLVDSRGPSFDDASLRAMHHLYIRYRAGAGEGSFEQDRAQLESEVAALVGAAWRPSASAGSTRASSTRA